jgi:hypothetical protein
LLDKKREASLNCYKDCDLFFYFDLFLSIIPLFCYPSASVLPLFSLICQGKPDIGLWIRHSRQNPVQRFGKEHPRAGKESLFNPSFYPQASPAGARGLTGMSP